MLKKYVTILFFLPFILFLPLQTFAAVIDENENRDVERLIFEEKNNEETETKNGEIEKEDSDLVCTKDIRFTLAQKKRLDQIYHQIYMDYIDLIETYAWAGALTQDQKLIRYKMLKNYILTFQKRNYKWCSEYEEDEWEEEWFNNDQD
ncbi:DUF2680 domain-containing protein [Bacillus sp. BRMEA1]|uniref:DUF2680 domain-containing protein n=1 Tax=Neobacillus endophyticus TaxID=2738405 RepID=UPI0015652B1E|nr:DUF2680 domain-containing protein [Neobacillus endophyticus]NRD79213.1 DUF2680 domain-containing protein [Neobacillus endophyticus]